MLGIIINSMPNKTEYGLFGFSILRNTVYGIRTTAYGATV